jgi:hypothetical protein
MPPKKKFIKTEPIDVENPITLENSNIQSILDETNDIIVYVNNATFIALNPIHLQENIKTFVECKFSNNKLMTKLTSRGKKYFHLGFYLNEENKNLLIDFNTLKQIKKYRIFNLESFTEQPIPTINLEYLKLSIFKKNPFLHDNDIYFDGMIRIALINYSYQWDQAINRYLIQGEEYFETNVYRQYWQRYGSINPAKIDTLHNITPDNQNTYILPPSNVEESALNVKNKMDDLDRCFQFAAPETENLKKTLWRGMSDYRYPINNVGDTYICPTFISTSVKLNTALKFMGSSQNSSLYKIVVANGVPFIDMKNNTLYPMEDEYLFPRGLKITHIGNGLIKNKPFILIKIDVAQPDQFTKPSSCVPMRLAKGMPMTIQLAQEPKPKSKSKPKPKPRSIELCLEKNKDYNPITQKCVPKCKSDDYVRNDNYRCVKTCAARNKVIHPETQKCVPKCKSDDYVRNDNYRCVKTCAARNKVIHPETQKCIPKCKPDKMRNEHYRCVKKKLKDIIITEIEECTSVEAMIKNGKRIGSGGYGAIYQLANGWLVKKSLYPSSLDVEEDKKNCLEGLGCKNDLLLEGLVMSVLSELNSEHFVKFEKIYKCGPNYYIMMENLGADCIPFTDFIETKQLSHKERLSILFQLTYALQLAHMKFSFVHGDLIGKNIMIKKVPREYKEYGMYGELDNQGIRVIIIDFGFSRLKYKGIPLYQTHRHPEWFQNDAERFDGTADICKIYNNPNFVKDLNIASNINKCKNRGLTHVAVPPFPINLTAEDILKSNLFDEITIETPSYSPTSPSYSSTSPISISPPKLKVITLNVWDGFTH